MEQNNELLNAFFDDIQTLSNAIKISSISQAQHVIRLLNSANSNSILLDIIEIEKATFALKSVFISLNDKKIKLNKDLILFLENASKKLLDISTVIKAGQKYDEVELKNFILYCDRIASGEIVEQENSYSKAEISVNNYTDDDKDLSISRSTITHLSNQINELFTSQQRLKNQFETILNIEENSDNIEVKKLSQQVKYNLNSINNILEETKNELLMLSMYPLQTVFNNVKSKQMNIPQLNQSREISLVIPQTAIVMDKQLFPKVENIINLCIKTEIQNDETVFKINVDSFFDGENIIISVKDNGNGFDEQTISKKLLSVFPEKISEFKKLNKDELYSLMFMEDYDRELNHIWKQVEEINGHVKIYSEKDTGCTITFSFPNTLSNIHGFFITSNKQKFFITGHHIIDTANNSVSTLHSIQNQYFYNYHGKEIPVYNLNSLINQGEYIEHASSGTIIITEYLNQNIGIIVENISEYVSLQKKDLPPVFENFSVLQGLVFDEQHDLIPILRIPEIMKKLVSLRNYDYKKFEVFSKKPLYKILIADDSETSRQIEKAALKSNDFYIEEAEDGIIAIEKLKQNKFDLVITDTSMPRMNGDILIENIKRMETYKTTPVIVIQPSTDKDEQTVYQKLGANAFISKNDFKRQDFIKLVKELIYE